MTRIQARVALPEEMQRRINPIREKWSPERALGNSAHVTIVYHDEAPELGHAPGHVDLLVYYADKLGVSAW